MKWKSFFSALGQQAIFTVVNQVLTSSLPPIVHPELIEGGLKQPTRATTVDSPFVVPPAPTDPQNVPLRQ
jgi:hypothetical protein